MYYLYILFSPALNEYYCGQTNNLDSRIKRHNSGETQSIKHGIPWELVGFLTFNSRKESFHLERKIKSRGIKRWLVTHQDTLIQSG
jgi:putative endonuclease